MNQFCKYLTIMTIALIPTLAVGQSLPVSQSHTLLKLGLLADIQYCDYPANGAREYRKSLSKLETAVKGINAEKVDFTVEVGDMIDRDFASFDPVLKTINQLHNKWVFIPGNHDFSVADSLKRTVWAMIPSKKGYSADGIGNFRFLYLNGFENSVIAWPSGADEYKENQERLKKMESEKAKNASDWNGGLGKKQLEWVQKEVDKANELGQKLIVFGHQPIIHDGAHSMWDSDKLIVVLSSCHSNVLYICGHNHAGSDHTIGNIRILNLRGMVEWPNPSWGILSLYTDHYELQGFGDQWSAERKW
jgi:predicted phosphodiesterase